MQLYKSICFCHGLLQRIGTTKEGLDIDDEDEKKKIEELKAEFEPLTKLMKEVLGDKVEKVIVLYTQG